MLRPDLTQLELTLCPFKEGRDRVHRMEPNGTIVYEEREGELFGPPRDLKGWQRDPDNPHRFTPLWPLCRFRTGTGLRLALCGCLAFIMRCSHPDPSLYYKRLHYSDCEHCKFREEAK